MKTLIAYSHNVHSWTKGYINSVAHYRRKWCVWRTDISTISTNQTRLSLPWNELQSRLECMLSFNCKQYRGYGLRQLRWNQLSPADCWFVRNTQVTYINPLALSCNAFVWLWCPTYSGHLVNYYYLRLCNLCRPPWWTSSGALWNVCSVTCRVWSLHRKLCMFLAIHNQ